MASRTSSYIPRFLLPQYGPMWRTRNAAFARPLNADLGQVLVRYASKVAAPKAVSKATTASKTAAAKKVESPKAASTKAGTPKVAAAAKAMPPKTATKTLPKTAPAKPPVTKAPAPKAATPKTPTSHPIAKTTIAKPATAPQTVVKPAAAPKTPAVAPAAIPAAAPAAVKTPAASPQKQIVLEKPEKFNPPSHGARLPKSMPKHYGPSLTAEEVQTQKAKQYPGLPPPNDSWSYWFLHNRTIHMIITLGTLSSLAIYTFIAKFNATSAFADMIPPISDLPSHPISYIRRYIEVIRLHEEHESAITAEKRRRRVDDVSKRNEYRKAHGLDVAQGFESWTGMSVKPLESKDLDPASPVVKVSTVPAAEAEVQQEPAVEPDLHINPDGKRKKYWGVF